GLHRPPGRERDDGGPQAPPRSARHGPRRRREPRCAPGFRAQQGRFTRRRGEARRRARAGGDRRGRRRRVSLILYRIDDRLIHGQVVVGWGQPLDVGFIVLVDDQVAASEWEQELYRMGTPPEMDVYFHSVADAATSLDKYKEDTRAGILLT